MYQIRQPAVAGTFYPDAPVQLAHDVASLLADAQVTPSEKYPKAIIVPHAGYIYSGAVAASVLPGWQRVATRLRVSYCWDPCTAWQCED
ncbi:hypothetical protein SFSGTM_23180 [Sulfuriferula nivalis]|uniref:AmmeMemoRadiSam system protein B n=1 Tax=Sulfuriferula nivalis TaxID=2675298 RepID=A0A809SIA5_9PROT|nr:hypothetical protein SFSGTM_23180 [Sulfuriferula nivalis]